MRHPLRLALIVCVIAAPAVIAQTTRPTTVPSGLSPTVAPQKAVAAVRTRPLSELKLDAVALSDVMDYFHDATGVNLVVDWPALQAAGVEKTAPVTLRLRTPTLRVALKKTLDGVAPNLLAFYVDGNVLHVTTQAVADARLVTRVYAVGDLMQDVPDFQGPELSLSNSNTGSRSGGGGGGSGGGNLFNGTTGTNTPGRSAVARGDALVNLIQTTIRPEVWDVNGGKSTVRVNGGRLIVVAPVAVQELIAGR